MPWIRTGNINYLYRRLCLLSLEIIPGFQVKASAAVSLEVPSQCDNVCNPSASVTPHVLPLPSDEACGGLATEDFSSQNDHTRHEHLDGASGCDPVSVGVEVIR